MMQRSTRFLATRGRTKSCLSVALLVFLVAPARVGAESVVIPAAKDNTLFQHTDGLLSSGSGEYFFAGTNNTPAIRRGVVAFDIAAHLPADAAIDSVALVLSVSSAPNDVPQTVTLHLLLADWGEGASVSGGGSGAPSTTGDATWIHRFYPDQMWTNPGGDFAAAISATRVVGVSGTHIWTSPAMAAEVQVWLDQPATNFGWMLRGNEPANQSVRRFDSRENASGANRPRLYVRYTTATPTRSATWGAVKSLYHMPRN